MPILLTLHVLGAVFLLGGMTAHALLRPAATSAAADARNALYQLAWRIQVVMVYTGSALLLITGVLLWVGRFKLFTGWLLLGVLLIVLSLAPGLPVSAFVTGTTVHVDGGTRAAGGWFRTTHGARTWTNRPYDP